MTGNDLVEAKSKPAAELLRSLKTIEIWPPNENNDNWEINICKLDTFLEMSLIFKND